MLFDVGLEGGEFEGLGVLSGQVQRFPKFDDRKVPHMGWNQVQIEKADCPLLKNVPEEAHFYFVHSYFVAPSTPESTWMTCDYGIPFCASVWRDNLFATQFHPEKSQKDGLQILKNFAEL